MRVLYGRNVNDLFDHGVRIIREWGVTQSSRAGNVKVLDCPVMSVYERPTERVLFDTVRDANPFFHLMEGLWMLSGRNDAAFLNRYISNFGERFAENDGTIHGAYGHRWRKSFGVDQLNLVVERLRSDPNDRQVVISMWDPTYNCCDGQDDLHVTDWRDRPCNTHVYLRVRDNAYRDPPVNDENSSMHELRIANGDNMVLDMTVCCRSNDIIWGAYGANAVHFSMLMEYLAGRIGVRVGKMYQFSNNYHAYVDVLSKMIDIDINKEDPYLKSGMYSVPMGSEWRDWDSDLDQFMTWHDNMLYGNEKPRTLEETLFSFKNEWFVNVAGKVALARYQWTHGMKCTARETCDRIAAPDWRRACLDWMERRRK